MWNQPVRYVVGSAFVVALLGITAVNVLAQPEDAPARPREGQMQRGEGRGPEGERPRGPRGEGERPGPGGGERGQGQGQGPRGGGMAGGGMMMLFEGIDLTQEQRDQIRTINQEARQANRAWREQNSDKIDAAQDEIEAARKALDEAEKKLADLLAGSPGSIESTRDKVMGVLTDEQKTKYQENLERFREQRGPAMMGPPRDGEGPRGPGQLRRDGGEGGQPRNRGGERESAPPRDPQPEA